MALSYFFWMLRFISLKQAVWVAQYFLNFSDQKEKENHVGEHAQLMCESENLEFLIDSSEWDNLTLLKCF